MPENLNPIIWERFCLFRRTKIEKEHKVKMNALTLAEMQAFLQKRREEDKAAVDEIKTISEELERLHKVKNRFMLDIKIQYLLKWGYVEESNTGATANYSESLLLHRNVVEDMIKTNTTLGEQKISTMVACKDFRMLIEDRQNKARDIKTLKLSEKQREYLQKEKSKKSQESKVSQQIKLMEETIAFKEKSHLKNVEHRKKKIEQLKGQATLKFDKSSVFDCQISDTEVCVAERNLFPDKADDPALQTEERYQEIIQRAKLKDLAQAQVEELYLLAAEVERQRTKNFPSLSQLHY
ncbi:hypothetical protein WMY93_017395 [Mugilogobius chulae]|uniref:Uncharacterized protein n=1 Tax=Mugilogobius chulae TaxID=88201 RepID=A0AAW0NQT8_9GOBI